MENNPPKSWPAWQKAHCWTCPYNSSRDPVTTGLWGAHCEVVLRPEGVQGQTLYFPVDLRGPNRVKMADCPVLGPAVPGGRQVMRWIPSFSGPMGLPREKLALVVIEPASMPSEG